MDHIPDSVMITFSTNIFSVNSDSWETVSKSNGMYLSNACQYEKEYNLLPNSHYMCFATGWQFILCGVVKSQQCIVFIHHGLLSIKRMKVWEDIELKLVHFLNWCCHSWWMPNMIKWCTWESPCHTLCFVTITQSVFLFGGSSPTEYITLIYIDVVLTLCIRYGLLVNPNRTPIMVMCCCQCSFHHQLKHTTTNSMVSSWY